MPAKVIHGHSIEIELGPSCPNPGIRRELEAQGKPYMCTSDIATWIGVDNKWYYVYRPGVSTSIIPLLELTKDEDIWNNSDEEPEDYEWIPETEIEDVYGIDFMESLPNIDDGEMVEIRIKCTAEKCE